MIKGNKVAISFVLAVFSLALLCAGCGKKADPRYPIDSYPGKVSDLAVSIEEGKAVLQWGVPVQRDRAGQVRVSRSALKTDGSDCPTCPRVYAVVDRLPLRDARAAEEGRFRYVDGKIREGFSYSYRVAVCTPSGVCGEESNTAEITVP